MEIDVLGYPYERRTMEFPDDDEGPVVATLVRRLGPNPGRRAVLWLHGWSDYFFHTHVADFFLARGYGFYALDLRKHGRSLLPHQTPTFCRSLTEYFPEIDESVRIIREEDGHEALVIAAHSTGALISALWAQQRRRAPTIDAMFFNSPFFEVNLPGWARVPVGAAAAELARRRPYGEVRRPTYPTYGHSLHTDFRGEWSYDLAWKPVGGFPVRYGWLAAVRAGQRRLRAGLDITVPVLVGCSTRSLRTMQWHELARRTDTVLNVADIVRWAPMVGRHVTILRLAGGMHDLTLSAAPVRKVLFSELERWLAAYLPVEDAGSPNPTAEPAPPARTAERTPERPVVERVPETPAAVAASKPGKPEVAPPVAEAPTTPATGADAVRTDPG